MLARSLSQRGHPPMKRLTYPAIVLANCTPRQAAGLAEQNRTTARLDRRMPSAWHQHRGGYLIE
jgi:hypothetical protein